MARIASSRQHLGETRLVMKERKSGPLSQSAFAIGSSFALRSLFCMLQLQRQHVHSMTCCYANVVLISVF